MIIEYNEYNKNGQAKNRLIGESQLQQVTCESFDASKIVEVRNTSIFQSFKMSHISNLDYSKFNQGNTAGKCNENSSIHNMFEDMYSSR